MPTAEDFKLELHCMMLGAMKEGKECVEINAGELHGRVGDYPGRNHRMPVCCEVMRNAIARDAGDVIEEQPPSNTRLSSTRCH
jgi:5-methylcytosine-specific restriction protein A